MTKPGPKIPDISDEILTKLLVEDKKTDKEAAAILNVSRNTIARSRNRLNIPIKPKCKKSEFTSEQDEYLKKLYIEESKNDYEVASLLHIGRTRLMCWRRKNNIKSKTNKKDLPNNICSEIKSKLQNGETLTVIGKSLNVKGYSIARLLKRNNYETGFSIRSSPPGILDYSLSTTQESVLMGEMFGDGGLVKGGPATAYYQCGHSIEQKDFVNWKYDIFYPLSCRKKENANTITMATWSNKSLFNYWKWFYPTGRGDKVLLPEMISKLDWLSLAVWFMGDGARDRKQVRFSVGKDQNLIPVVESMNQKFGNMFEACLYEKEWFLKIRDNESFFKEISPYLLPYFSYKIPCATPIINKLNSSKKCHQKIMKEEKLEADLKNLSFDPKTCPIDEYIFSKEDFSDEIKEFLKSYEWLKSVGVSSKWCFTMRLKGHLAGVQILNEPAAYSKLLDTVSMKLECLVQRGCTVSWAHQHLGSKMLMASVNWMVQNTEKRLFVGYADPAAAEVGIIYQATNFKYLGENFGGNCLYKHPTYRNGKEFSAHSLKRTSIFKAWCKQNSIAIESSWIKSNGFKDLKQIPVDIKNSWYDWAKKLISESEKIKISLKGKYVLLRGRDRREHKILNSLFKVKTFPYPKR